MSAIRLSLAQARTLQLAALGLAEPLPRRAAGRAALVAAIRRMHLLQIDTISVVARSPYLVLYSRIGAYPQVWLDQALAEGELVETWAHEACFAPVECFPLHRAHQRQRQHWSQRMAQRAEAADGPAIAALLEQIARTGAVRSADFQRETPGASAWWGWKPEKRWLESAFAQGRLMVARREQFHRVYDLPERVLAHRPELLSAHDPEPAELRSRFILDAVQALGVSTARWLADYFRLNGRVSDAELEPALARGDLIAVQIADWAQPAYVAATQRALLDAVLDGTLLPRRSVLLSPFDPLVWDRQRALELFDFDYRLECYTPAPKRQFGYFVLPLLDRGTLVGRVDAKAHRSSGVFEVKDLYLQAGIRPGAALAQRIARALRHCADWHATPQVELGRVDPAAFDPQLRAALRD